MYRIATPCLLVCLSVTVCTIGVTVPEMLTPSSGVSPTPEPTLSAPTPVEWSTLSPVPPTSAPSPTATSSPQPSATPTTPATPRPTAHSEAPPATATLSPVVLPDDALPIPFIVFKSEGPDVYLVQLGCVYRRRIVDWETFLHLGFEQSDILTNTGYEHYIEGPPITRLLKGTGEQVYWMENGQRRHIPDMETFSHLGYRQEDISELPDRVLNSWPLGDPLPSVLGTPAEPVPPPSQEMVVLTYQRCGPSMGGFTPQEIYTVYTDGRHPKRLSHYNSLGVLLYGSAWSPDGRYIAFSKTQDHPRTSTIVATSADQWDPIQLGGNGNQDPVWSPDGERIAFWSSAGTGGVYVMDADGENPQWLANGLRPTWTPDGRIAFCARGAGDLKSMLTLTVMDADGQNQQPVGHSITVLDQHYYPWRQEVWVSGSYPCGTTEP